MAYTIKKWKLDELFPGFDSPELQAAFDNVEEQVASFEGVRGKLKPDMDADNFLEVVRASEADDAHRQPHLCVRRAFLRRRYAGPDRAKSAGTRTAVRGRDAEPHIVL